MKRLFTLLGLAIIPFGLGAQSIEIYYPGETDDISGTVVELENNTSSMHQEFDVKNVSGETLDLRITRVKIIELAGTEDYLCWGADALTGACYSAEIVAPNNPWTTPDMTPLMNDSIGWLSTYHETEGISGCAQYRYYIIDDTDARLDSVDVMYCSTVSIEEERKPDISIFPNPTSSNVNVVLKGGVSNVSLTLYNVLGDELMHTSLTSGQSSIDVSGLPNGVYFYSILRQNQIIETKKLIIRH